MYLFMKDSTTYLIREAVKDSIKYVIWIESVNHDGFAEKFNARIEAFYFYDEDRLSVSYHALMKSSVHNTWHWTTTLKLLGLVGRVTGEAVKEAYSVAKRKI